MDIHDVFGIEPVGKAGEVVTKGVMDGISSFLSSVFKPGLEELGFLMKDRVRQWRLNNILRMLEKAKGRLEFNGNELNLTANARVGLAIMDESSKVDNEELQDLWAGLFVSSCTSDGHDDSNMNFVDLMRRMSTVEARILDYACRRCQKLLCCSKLIVADNLTISFDTLVSIAGTNDRYRLDSELDHMRSIELLVSDGLTGGGGFSADDDKLDANITPSSLALNLYYKTHSIGQSPIEFWGDSLHPYNEKIAEMTIEE